MSQDSFAAALDAELFGSDDGTDHMQADPADSAQASPASSQQKRARSADSPGAGGSDGEGDPFAALDRLEEEEEEGPLAAAAPAPAPAAPARPASAGGCSHPGYMFGLCIRCGAAKPEGDGGGGDPGGGPAAGGGGGGTAPAAGMRIKHLHARQALEVSPEEAARITAGAIPSLLASRRLVLVLDLDHTLLNSVREGDVSADERPLLAEILDRQRRAAAGAHEAAAAAAAAAAAEAAAAAAEGGEGARRRREEDRGEPGGDGEGGGGGERQPREQEQQQEQQGGGEAAGPSGGSAVNGAEGEEEREPPQRGQQEEQEQQRKEARAAANGGGQAAPDDCGGGGGGGAGGSPLPAGLGWWHPPLLYHLAHCRLWTKLRPGLREFLRDASRLYELHIYTMGDKAYAREIAALLDPGGRLFAGRVISAADSTKTHEKGLDVLLASEAHVLVLDDTEHVWKKHARNLIQVERYHFFGSSIRSWQPTAEGLLEGRTDEGEATGMLATCLRVLTEVHAEFFAGTGAEDSVAAPAPAASASGASGGAEGGALKASTKRRRVRGGGAGGNGDGRSGSEGPGGGAAGAAAGASAARLVDPSALRGRDVRTCLADARARVLRGACVCFSRCWPQSFSAFDQPLWVLAESLGADCSTHYVPGRTTHVVAAPDRTGELPLTDKVQAARRDGVHVVHYDWLVASKFRWKRTDEAVYEMPAYSQSGRAAGAKARGFSWQPAAAESDAAIARRAAGRAGG